MADLGNREELKRNTDEDPDIDLVKDAYKHTLTDLSSYFAQTSINFDERNSQWEGQNKRTGRKHGSETHPAHPWEKASDIRTFVLDTIINENAALLVESLLKGNLTAIPVEGNDIERGRMISSFMKWLIFSQIKDIRRQAKILANFQEEKAVGAMAVLWDTRIEPTLQEVTIETFQQFLQPSEDEQEVDAELAEMIETLLSIIEDKEMVNEVADILITLFPNAGRRKAKKMAKELRETGQTSIAVPSVVWNRPVLKALSIDEDFFFSPNILDIQDAAYVFHSEYLTPEQLRARVNQGWDKEWVDTVIKTTVGKTPEFHLGLSANSTAMNNFQEDLSIDIAHGFVRVVNAYSKETTEDGIPGVFLTSFHPDVGGFGKSGLLGYKPSRYPFVVFPREYRTKRILDSKGVPEIGKGSQDEIKVQQDSRVDRTTLATCPPRFHALGRKPSAWGPGDSLGVRRKDEAGFMEIPPFDQGSIEIERAVRDNMNRMFGRPVDEQNAQWAQMMQQDMIDQWLANWKQVFDHVWDLHQQFGPDEQFFRVVGSGNADAMQFIRSQEQERFDFYLDFAVANQDAAVLLEKLEKAGQIMSQFNANGTADFDEYQRAFLGAIDPSYADRFIKPIQTATEEEVRKTQADISNMVSGHVVNAPENANVELRKQTIQQWLQGTEEIPGTDNQEKLQSDPELAARFQQYMKQLDFQETQKQNALIGRLGTTPGNALPTS